ncbi:MAG: two-component system response regulator [Promethearchaeota archaeon]
MAEEAKMKNTILIVNYEPDIVNLTEKFLRLGQFDTITSNNVKEAMKMVEENYDKIALILSDIMLPGESGYDLLKEIKKNERYKDILVVFYTIKRFNEDIQKAKNLGVDDYIVRPISVKELLERIKVALGKETQITSNGINIPKIPKISFELVSEAITQIKSKMKEESVDELTISKETISDMFNHKLLIGSKIDGYSSFKPEVLACFEFMEIFTIVKDYFIKFLKISQE